MPFKEAQNKILGNETSVMKNKTPSVSQCRVDMNKTKTNYPKLFTEKANYIAAQNRT